MMRIILALTFPAVISAFSKSANQGYRDSLAEQYRNQMSEDMQNEEDGRYLGGIAQTLVTDEDVGSESESLFSAAKSYVEILEALLMYELDSFFTQIVEVNPALGQKFDKLAAINDLTRDFVLFKDDFMDKIKEAAMKLLTHTEEIMNMAHLVGKDHEVSADIDALTTAMYSAFDMMQTASENQGHAMNAAFQMMRGDQMKQRTAMIQSLLKGANDTNNTFEDILGTIDFTANNTHLEKETLKLKESHKRHNAAQHYIDSAYSVNADVMNWHAWCGSQSAEAQMCPMPCAWVQDESNDANGYVDLCVLSCSSMDEDNCNNLGQRLDRGEDDEGNPPCSWNNDTRQCEIVELSTEIEDDA